ncbi:hypothetical protein [Citromicrobium sp. JLT1363]|uniref:hypothetical protein n=1 Tax=Citromicrobium sp. JLT1363 TaxID=517722 RepID=UPI000225EBFC|nr:hypothetical protein [Citromicrobium sp. JLT1363]
MAFQTGIGEVPHNRTIGQNCQLRTEPTGKAAIYPDDGAQADIGLACGSQRPVVLIREMASSHAARPPIAAPLRDAPMRE